MVKKYIAIFIHIFIIIGFNVSYYYVICPLFDYMGFSAVFSLDKVLVISFLTLAFLGLGVSITNPFISLVWWIFFYMFYVGESIYYQYAPAGNMKILIGICLLLLLLPLCSASKVKLVPHQIKGDSLTILVIFSILLFLPILVATYKYINIQNLLFIDVYDTRAVFKENTSGIIGYLFIPLSRIFIPYIIIKSLELKKYNYVALGIGLILYLYLCGAVKSVFMGLLAVLLFYAGTYWFKQRLWVVMMTVVGWGGFLQYHFTEDITIIDMFTRRVIFVPAFLNNLYVHYFTNNYTYYSHSPLGLGLTEDMLGGTPLSIFLGEAVMGKEINANAGIITEGYVGFGMPGVIAIVLLIVLLFAFLNSLDVQPQFFGIIFVYIYLANTAFLSVFLLTHGLLAFILFAYFYLSKNTESDGLSTMETG